MKTTPDLLAFGLGLALLTVGACAAWGLAGLIAPGLCLMAVAVFGPRGESERA